MIEGADPEVQLAPAERRFVSEMQSVFAYYAAGPTSSPALLEKLAEEMAEALAAYRLSK
jgi:hypothetical protein